MARQFGRALVLRAARDRFAPTFTSLVAVGAVFMGLVVAGGGAGREIVHPMAVVVVGGIVTSAIVSLLARAGPVPPVRRPAGREPRALRLRARSDRARATGTCHHTRSRHGVTAPLRPLGDHAMQLRNRWMIVGLALIALSAAGCAATGARRDGGEGPRRAPPGGGERHPGGPPHRAGDRTDRPPDRAR